MRKLISLAVGFLVVLSAGCGSSGSTAGSGSTTTSASSSTSASTTTSTTAPVDPKADAIALARRMAGEAVLPPGATPSTAPLPSLLRKPFEEPGGGNIVVANREWTVASDPDAVVTFLKTHPSPGFTESGVGSSGGPTEHAQDVVEVLQSLPPNVSEAGLEIGVEAAAAGGSIVNVFGGVQWTEVKPAAEYVPTTDHVVIISVVRVFQPGKPVVRRVVVTDAATVARIVRTFDALRVSPPGLVFNCYLLTNKAVSYRIAFAATATATPDLVATAAACSTTAVTAGGHRLPALSATLGAFGTAVAHALGKTTLTFE